MASLPKDEDVQRALLWNPELRKGFKNDPGEEIYPTTGWIGDYLEYAKYNHVPTAMHFWVAISVLGCACKRNFYIDRGTFRIYPSHQYILLTGKKAVGKSAALEVGADMIARVNRQLDEEMGSVHAWVERPPVGESD